MFTIVGFPAVELAHKGVKTAQSLEYRQPIGYPPDALSNNFAFAHLRFLSAKAPVPSPAIMGHSSICKNCTLSGEHEVTGA